MCTVNTLGGTRWEIRYLDCKVIEIERAKDLRHDLDAFCIGHHRLVFPCDGSDGEK